MLPTAFNQSQSQERPEGLSPADSTSSVSSKSCRSATEALEVPGPSVESGMNGSTSHSQNRPTTGTWDSALRGSYKHSYHIECRR